MRRFELPTPRPPDEYSNRTELHPELFAFFKDGAKIYILPISATNGIQKIRKK